MSRSASEPVSGLHNLGPKTERMLKAIGVRSADELRTLGLAETYWRLRIAGFNFSLVGLYALEGALTGTHWNAIRAERKLELRRLADQVRAEVKLESSR